MARIIDWESHNLKGKERYHLCLTDSELGSLRSALLQAKAVLGSLPSLEHEASHKEHFKNINEILTQIRKL